MDLMEKTGLRTFIGKVKYGPQTVSATLQEKSAVVSVRDTVRWLTDTAGKYENVKPILTPRFTPSWDRRTHDRSGRDPENLLSSGTVSSFRKPKRDRMGKRIMSGYFILQGKLLDQFGLFGGENCPTIMAHCVYSSDAEISLMKKRNVFIAHCPQSNTNLSDPAIAPARRYLDEGLHIGLGTDIAGGHSLPMLRAVADAIQVSKLPLETCG